MTEEVENHTLRLLQDIRAEMREGFSRLGDRIDVVETKLDGNTVLLSMVAGISHDHEKCIETLEAKSH